MVSDQVVFMVELMFLQVMKLLLLLSSAASVKLELLGLRINWPWYLRSLPGRLLSFQHHQDNVTSASWYFSRTFSTKFLESS